MSGSSVSINHTGQLFTPVHHKMFWRFKHTNCQTCFCMWLIFYEKRRRLRVWLCSYVSSSALYKSTKYFRNFLLQPKPELLLKRPSFKMFPSTSRFAWRQDSITQHQGDFFVGLPPGLTSFWIISSQNFFQISISAQRGWQAGTNKVTLHSSPRFWIQKPWGICGWCCWIQHDFYKLGGPYKEVCDVKLKCKRIAWICKDQRDSSPEAHFGLY